MTTSTALSRARSCGPPSAPCQFPSTLIRLQHPTWLRKLSTSRHPASQQFNLTPAYGRGQHIGAKFDPIGDNLMGCTVQSVDALNFDDRTALARNLCSHLAQALDQDRQSRVRARHSSDTVVPLASVAAMTIFSVAPTDAKRISCTAPFRPPEVLACRYPSFSSISAPSASSPSTCRSIGRAPMAQPPGSETTACPKPCQQGTQHQGLRRASCAQYHNPPTWLVRLWLDIAITCPSCNADTSAPSDCSRAVIVLMSLSRGALVSVSGSSLSKVAGISVRHAFLAPAIGICPLQRAIARHQNRIHLLLSLVLAGLVPGCRSCFGLRLTPRHVRF